MRAVHSLLCVSLIPVIVHLTSGASAQDFRRGDADANGGVNICDAFFIVDTLFIVGIPGLPCEDAADADDSGDVNIADAVFISDFLFREGAEPPPPGPTTCGPDPTPDLIACAAYGVCAVTNPPDICDNDEDGLRDDWEAIGIDTDGDGTVDLDLPAMGADRRHKDIFVEIDYMVSTSGGGHSHQPKAAALDMVIKAFAAAPVTNPDGTTGIRLHLDAGSGSIMNPVTGATWGTTLSKSDELTHQDALGSLSGSTYDWNFGSPESFESLRTSNFILSSPGRSKVFHYCIFAHHLGSPTGPTGHTGVSRGTPGSDFIVSLGGKAQQVGTEKEQAGTLMHELGHNLNLKHGGTDETNYKPNHLSVMSYFFQTRGLVFHDAAGNEVVKFDYSRFDLPKLKESDLNEELGLMMLDTTMAKVPVPGTTGYGTRIQDGICCQRIVCNINAGIDWDGDTMIETMSSAKIATNTLFENVACGTSPSASTFCNPSGASCCILATSTNDKLDCKALQPDPKSDPGKELSTLNEWTSEEFMFAFPGGSIGSPLGVPIDQPAVTPADELTREEDARILTPFAVAVTGPGLDEIEPCQTRSYKYTVTNTGLSDDVYKVEFSSSQGFADGSTVPEVLELAGGASTTFTIDAAFPDGVPAGTEDRIVIAVESVEHSSVRDSAETLLKALGDDGDGVASCVDDCPRSDMSATLVIGGCDTEVKNRLLPGGCTMADEIQRCAALAGNDQADGEHRGRNGRNDHDDRDDQEGRRDRDDQGDRDDRHDRRKEFLSCVKQLTKSWEKSGLVNKKESARIEKCVKRLERE